LSGTDFDDDTFESHHITAVDAGKHWRSVAEEGQTSTTKLMIESKQGLFYTDMGVFLLPIGGVR
jgi:hypothetical protein